MAGSPEPRQILAQGGLCDLPPEWDAVTLGSLLSPNRGISVGVMYPGDHCPDGVPLIRATDLNGNTINPFPAFRISAQKHQEYRRTELEGGEVILTLVGRVGQCAVVPPTMAGWNTARAVAVVRLSDASEATFVAFCLRAPTSQHIIDVWCNTTVQATLNLKEVKQIPLPWPPQRERVVIATILGALDDKIELNRRMNRTLEEMARAIFKSWFVDFDPVRAKAAGRQPRGMKPELATLFPDSFENSELGEIPKGWHCRPLPDVCHVNPSRTLPKGMVAPYLDMASMPTQGPSAETWVMRETGSGMKFINGDTLVARITPCLENGKTAFVDFLPDGRVGWGSTEYIVLRPRGVIPPVFAYLLARSAEFRTFAIQQMTGSSGRQRVPADSLGKFQIVSPESDATLFQYFGKLVAPMFERISGAVREARTLAAIRDALLPKLISGELRVPDAERIVSRAINAGFVEAEVAGARPASRVLPAPDIDTVRAAPDRTTSPKSQVLVPDKAEQAQPRLTIDDYAREEVLAAIRDLYREDSAPCDRETLLGRLRDRLGFGALGSKIRERLEGDLSAAVRRGVLERNNGEYRMCCRNIDEYARDFLKDLFVQSLARGWQEREETITQAARYLGFRRTGDNIRAAFKSVINGLIRDGRVEADGARIRRA